MLSMNRHKILKCFRKEKHDFRSGDRSYLSDTCTYSLAIDHSSISSESSEHVHIALLLCWATDLLK